MGMSPDEFWYGDTSNISAYKKAHVVKRKLAEEDAWLNGLYVYNAVAACMSSEVSYPDSPLGMFPDKDESRTREERAEAESRERIEEFKRRWAARKGS